jgi:holliday junction DNA helicase RuvB
MREDYLTGDAESLNPQEKEFDKALRPLSFEDFSGQGKIVDNLQIFVGAAKAREEALDHVLLHGPPGLGKTTLSHIIANELGSSLKISSGPVLDKPSDLAGLLTNLQPYDVGFRSECAQYSDRFESIYLNRSYNESGLIDLAIARAIWD